VPAAAAQVRTRFKQRITTTEKMDRAFTGGFLAFMAGERRQRPESGVRETP
jgi:hypothetical protein